MSTGPAQSSRTAPPARPVAGRIPLRGAVGTLALAACVLSQGCGGAAAPAESGHDRMVRLLREVAARVPQDNFYLGDAQARRLRAMIQAAPPDAPPARLAMLHFQLGEAELALGNEPEALEQFRRAHDLAAGVPGLPPRALAELKFGLGVAYMRLAETRNCCRRNSPDSCLLPIRGDGIHQDREGAENAARLFTEVLELTARGRDERPAAQEPGAPTWTPTPAGTETYMDALWLLNVAVMTLGEYPEGVPEAYRIPAAAFESAEPIPRFVNVAARLGLDSFTMSGGVIVDDFTNDGHLDLIVSSWDPRESIRFWVNDGDGTFTDRSRESGVADLLGGLNMIQADYDNDGHTDFLVLRGAWLHAAGRYPNSLVRNNGDGTFTDATFDAGLGEVHYPTQTAAWADYDRDGDLDLYVGNESFGPNEHPCQLFRNEGDGTFTDVAAEAGVQNDAFAKAVTWGDYDGDHLPDLYVSNLLGPNRLYRNNGDGSFTDVAAGAGVDAPERSFPAWFWDFDNDGALDLFVSSYSAGIGDLAASYRDGFFLPDQLPRLYRGDGRGGFEEVGRRRDLLRPSAPMGANFGDLDNDGFLDFYLGTGYPPYSQVMPNVMYRNRDGQRFTDVTFSGGFGHLQKGHAIAFADLDHDGDQDVFAEMGGAYPGDRFHDALYENPGFGNHWLGVRLVGVRSNRSAIGARIRVVVREGASTRSVFKHVNSGGTFGANPLRQVIGLGAADAVERVEILWPATGTNQTFTDVPLDRYVEIVEGEDRPTLLDLPARPFEGASENADGEPRT